MKQIIRHYIFRALRLLDFKSWQNHRLLLFSNLIHLGQCVYLAFVIYWLEETFKPYHSQESYFYLEYGLHHLSLAGAPFAKVQSPIFYIFFILISFHRSSVRKLASTRCQSRM